MILSNLFTGFPQSFWEKIGRIGRAKWVSVRPIDGTGDAAEFHAHLDALDEDVARWVANVLRSGSGNDVFVVEALGRCVADGPKVFAATAEQCEALEHVDVKFPAGDYRQAFPVVLVRFSKEFVASLRTDHQDFAIPDFVAVRWHERERIIFITGFRSDYGPGDPLEKPADNCLVIVHGDDRTIADSLKKSIDIPNPEAACMGRLYRVALNLMLLMTHHPFTVRASNPGQLAKAQTRLRKRRIAANEVEVASHVYEVAFNQNVIVREVRGPSPDHGGTHASPHPHWRRGHWRRAPGTAMGTRATVFVRPCLVRGAEFAGSLAETSAVYRT